ncbi:MAG: ATP-binding protein [Bacteroidota bacterium]|nr:ATP-binding protein [Bacteroidota bacterium]
MKHCIAMDFINRNREIKRIGHALSSKESMLVVLYGRRRIGKTRIIQQLMKDEDIYFIADQRETPLQIASFAKTIAKKITGFDSVVYPDWEVCLLALNERLTKRITLIIDEFPYLAKSSPELVSILQKLYDTRSQLSFHLLLCGSSQQMMHKMAIASTSPLYGRANEIIKLRPLNIYWLREVLNCTGTEAVEEYCIWGGIPRYWELRAREIGMREAVVKHILDSQGILHEEPMRLFLDDSRDIVQMSTIIEAISSGAHRLSEIASRMGKPITHLNRPIQRLIELGYIKREIPYGITPRNAKKTLYKIADPFINFYFSYVIPEKTSLGMGLAGRIFKEVVEPGFPAYCSGYWEELCRASTPMVFRDKLFKPGSRWWGTTIDKEQIEIDVVASSQDGTEVIAGEAKWTASVNIHSLCNNLNKKCEAIPALHGKKIRKSLFLKNKPEFVPEGFHLFTPEDVVSAFKSTALGFSEVW